MDGGKDVIFYPPSRIVTLPPFRGSETVAVLEGEKFITVVGTLALEAKLRTLGTKIGTMWLHVTNPPLTLRCTSYYGITSAELVLMKITSELQFQALNDHILVA
jgi:hypothetical protein